MKQSVKSIAVAVALTTALAASVALWLFTLGPYRTVELPEVLASAQPPVLGRFEDDGPIADRTDWLRRRTQLLGSLAQHIYGPAPADREARVLSRSPIPAPLAGGVERVEQWEVEIEEAGRLHLVLVLPPQLRAAAPVIIMQNFCGNRAAFPGRPAAVAAPRQYYPIPCRIGAFDPLHRAAFGRWMLGPPFERIGARGYAIAMYYGGDIVADHAPDARPALNALAGSDAGAVSAWAWVHARVVDVLSEDPRLDVHRMIAWGQSRYGKIALLAAARDERIAAIVAVQSGRAGDALTSHRAGESVVNITRVYPHWLSPRFADYAARNPPVDQHQLLALLAPRPVLLGWARRDGWSDPAGALIAVQSARPAFELLGAPAPEHFFRGGGHGIEDADWETTLEFLDRRLGRPVQSGLRAE
ncbi:MAG: alpha/beta hydrolase family protein [Hyphomonadaceae bacterium]